MQSLEEVIEELDELDDYRRKAAEMRDQGQQALVKLFPRQGAEFDLSVLKPASILSGATVLKALLVRSRGRVKRVGKESAAQIGELAARLTAYLEDTAPRKIFALRPDKLPILRAARAMSTLVTAPDSAFSRSVFGFYYVIVREIFTADSPDWTIGGARAGEASAPSAFVTGECTRAIMGLHKALANTAHYIDRVAAMIERREQSNAAVVPPEWLEIDKNRAALEFLTTAELQKGNIALKLKPLESTDKLDRFLDESPSDIQTQIELCLTAFTDALDDIDVYRRGESDRKAQASSDADRAQIEKQLIRSSTAHLVAQGAVEWAVKKADEANKVFTNPEFDTPAKKLRRVAVLFDEAAAATAKLLHPATEFLSRVLDRQLAGALAGSTWDAAEMGFAAVAFGYVTGRWDDERLAHAAKHLINAFGSRGRFPVGQPIFTNDDGFTLPILNAEVIRAFAQLLQHVTAVEVTSELARRMLVFLEDTRLGTGTGTWHNDDVRIPKSPRPWVTASAVYALDRINRMLDSRINRRVFDFFTVRMPGELEVPALPDLFYPDYGLAHQKVRASGSAVPRESVAAVLERMRAHVVGVADEQRWGEVTWSLILYGPPGTGKTTLVESLARSCNVPLIDVTPSDIVVAGVDQVERRTRAVFKALSLLTRVVIMFDEFEPVLQKRKDDDPNPTVFSFVTPGMLPKLKNLHDMAERRGVAYVLNTNLLRKLDDAAIRTGRFDRRIGVYPPDPLSRIGRLFTAIHEFEQKNVGKTAHRNHAWEVILSTVSGPMNTLGKPGWYTKPKQIGTGRKNAFEYIFGQVEEYEPPPPEADLARHTGGRDAAKQEFYDWSFAVAWDDAVRKKRPDEPDLVSQVIALAPKPDVVSKMIESVPSQREPKAARPAKT